MMGRGGAPGGVVAPVAGRPVGRSQVLRRGPAWLPGPLPAGAGMVGEDPPGRQEGRRADGAT